MSLIAVTGVGDAPGATTTAFALTLAWPHQVVLAECSPAGGRLLRGYFQCQEPPDRGLWEVGLAAVRGPDAAAQALWEQTIPLDEGQQRMLLPGLNDPFVAVQLSAATWETLAQLFTDLPSVVLADVGPIVPELPFPLLRAADLVLVVMRPTLAQVAAARVRLGRLRQALGPDVPVALCLIGERPYTAGEIRARLGDFTLISIMPVDDRSAQVLWEGGGSDRTRRKIAMSPLLRQAATVSRTLHRHITDRHRAVRSSPTTVRQEATS